VFHNIDHRVLGILYIIVSVLNSFVADGDYSRPLGSQW